MTDGEGRALTVRPESRGEEVLPPAVDLGRLIAELGPNLIDLVVAPRGTGVAITSVALSIPNEPLHAMKGELVLATGVKPSSNKARLLLATLGEAEAAAVIFKLPAGEAPPDLIAAATEAGVAVVAVDPDIVWTQLYSFVRTVMATSGTGSAAAGQGAIGDLFALANAVASMVGGPVTIEDLRSNVLAYSTLDGEIDEPRRKAILGRRVPTLNQEVLKSAGVFRALWASDDVIQVVDDDVGMPDPMRPRLVIAVRAGDDPLGSIWVQEGDSPFDEAASDALREAARIAALHMVHDRYRDDLARRQHSEVAHRLLDGSGPRADLGTVFESEPYLAVVAFEIEAGDPADDVVRKERNLDLIRTYCDAFRLRSVETVVDGLVYAILGLRSPDRASAHRLAEHITTHPDNAGAEVRAGVGAVVSAVRDVPRSRRSADKTLRALRLERGDRKVASNDDVAPEVFLLDLRDAVEAEPDVSSGLIEPLLMQDRERQTSYLETLRAYLQCFGDLPRAAASIDVHPNTFRYRLKRACEFASIDLDDHRVRLALELELYWLSLLDRAESAAEE